MYNASNNELVRTKTLVKNCIVLIDSTPYRQWYEAHYALPLGRKKGAKLVWLGLSSWLLAQHSLPCQRQLSILNRQCLPE